jgi:hemerythrin-like domain-containing protein
MSKPLKRHPFIVEFSKDHHYSLLLIWKLKQGIKKNIALERMKAYIDFYAENDIKPHFLEEEQILFTLLNSSDPHLIDALEQHVQLLETMTIINQGPCTLQTVEHFMTLLESHIRFEERVLFPHIQNTVNLEEFQTGSKELHHQNELDTRWTDNFWE